MSPGPSYTLIGADNEPITKELPPEKVKDKLKVTGTVMDFYLEQAVVGFAVVGGATIGVPTDIKGAKLGDQVTLDVEVVEAFETSIQVTFTNKGAGSQLAELDRGRVTFAP